MDDASLDAIVQTTEGPSVPSHFRKVLVIYTLYVRAINRRNLVGDWDVAHDENDRWRVDGDSIGCCADVSKRAMGNKD